MLLEKVWWKIQSSRKTTFSSLKINDFKSDFEERTFLKFWSKKFEICSNSIFCSQILHGVFLARALWHLKRAKIRFFEKCFRILDFFFSKLNFQHAISRMILERNVDWGQQKLNFSKLYKMARNEHFSKTPALFFWHHS